MIPEPTVSELLTAGANAVKGTADKTADFIRGSDYEAFSGSGAILWSRQAQRDTDLFHAIRFNDAEGDDLTRLVSRRFGIERYLATRGVGTAVFERSAVSTAADTIWKGTRVRLGFGNTEARFYRVTTNVAVAADVNRVTVPIEAVEYGPGSAVNTTTGLYLVDPLTDPSLGPLWNSEWRVTSLSCVDGQSLEPANAFRERVRRTRRDQRVGYPTAIIEACKKVGASNVAIFRSDYGGLSYDDGLNVVYVGDLGYSTSASLLRDCTLALRSIRVAGDCLQVFPMQKVNLVVDADVYLRDSPSSSAIARMNLIHRAAVLRYIGGTKTNFIYTRNGLAGAIANRHTPEVQRVSFNSPSSDASVRSGSAFPAILNRYVISDQDITLNYLSA